MSLRSRQASYDVKTGDELVIKLGAKPLRVLVLSVQEHAKKEEAGEMYRVLEDPKI